MCTGVSVESPGRPAKLGPLRMFLLTKIRESLLVKAQVMHLRKVSRSAIGLTLLRLSSQSEPLGIE